jgi:hypothetical protein
VQHARLCPSSSHQAGLQLAQLCTSHITDALQQQQQQQRTSMVSHLHM